MQYINERIAYLKGLTEGLDIDKTTKEGKLLTAIVDVLEDMAFAISDLEEATEELYDFEIEDEEEYTYECPNCGAFIDVEEKMMENEEQLICPKCGDPIKIAIDCDCEHHMD